MLDRGGAVQRGSHRRLGDRERRPGPVRGSQWPIIGAGTAGKAQREAKDKETADRVSEGRRRSSSVGPDDQSGSPDQQALASANAAHAVLLAAPGASLAALGRRQYPA